jgi:hypothetical protein
VAGSKPTFTSSRHSFPVSLPQCAIDHLMKILAWNIARRSEPWRELADSDAEVALLQEATAPPRDVEHRLGAQPGALAYSGTRSPPYVESCGRKAQGHRVRPADRERLARGGPIG